MFGSRSSFRQDKEDQLGQWYMCKDVLYDQHYRLVRRWWLDVSSMSELTGPKAEGKILNETTLIF